MEVNFTIHYVKRIDSLTYIISKRKQFSIGKSMSYPNWSLSMMPSSNSICAVRSVFSRLHGVLVVRERINRIMSGDKVERN